MADMIWANASLFAKKEATEGTANAPAAGDAILCAGLAPKLQRDFHPRKYRGSVGQRPGVIGAQTGPGLSFESEIKGNGTNNTCELDELLEAAFGAVSAGGASTTITGSASTTTSINVVSDSGFTVGNMVNIQLTTGGVFESTMITAVSGGGVLTVSPALTAAPVTAGTTVDEMRTYQIIVPPAGVNSLTMDVFYNADAGAGQFDRFVGCHGNVKWSSPRAGSIPMLAWEFLAWNWVQSLTGTRPSPTYDSASPKASLASKLKVAGVLVDAHDIEWDLGVQVFQKVSQNSALGIYGTPVVDVNPSGSFRIHPAHTSIAQFTGWTAETAVSLSQQVGNARFGTVAWYCPQAIRREVSRGDDGGVHTNEVQWDATVQDDALATTVDASLYLAVG